MTFTPTRRQLLTGLAAPAVRTRSPRRPNILWLMTDEQRPDSLRCYASPWAHSPHLDRLAAEGVLFESAYVPAPVSVPSRCSLLTGNYGSTTGVLHNQQRLPPGTRFLTWALEDAGYQTASFGKKHYFYEGRQAFREEGGAATEGIVEPERYGPEYDPSRYDVIQYPELLGPGPRRRWILGGRFPARRKATAEARNVDLCIDWLKRRDPSRPFLLRLSLNAPHTPVVAPPEFLSAVERNKIDLPLPSEAALVSQPARERACLRAFQGAFALSVEQVRKARHYYYARAAFVDSEIGRLLDFLRRLRLLDGAIIVFTADHGAHLGDHGLFQKLTFYEQVVTVPFIFRWDGLARPGARLRRPVSTASLLPTVLEWAGVELPWPIEAPSLAEPIASGREPASGPVFSELAFGYLNCRDAERQVMVREGRWKLSEFPGSPEPDPALYDLDHDPGETTNLAGNERFHDVLARLRRLIQHWDRIRSTHATRA